MRGHRAARELAETGVLRDRTRDALGKRARDAHGMEQSVGKRQRARLEGERDTLNRSRLDATERRKAHERSMADKPKVLQREAQEKKAERDNARRAQQQAAQRAQQEGWKTKALEDRAKLARADASATPNPALLSKAQDLEAQRDVAQTALADAKRNANDAGMHLASAEGEYDRARLARDGYAPSVSDLDDLRDLRDEETRLFEERNAVQDELRGLRVSEGPMSEADARRHLDDRRSAIDMGADPEAPEQLMWAGVDPETYASSSTTDRDAMLERSREAMERDRELFEQYDSEGQPEDVHRSRVDDARVSDPGFDAEARRRADEAEARSERERRVRRWRR
jgi:hypothetical protein